jgi:hypothetical protein
MAMHPAGTPIIRTTTGQIDKPTDARSVIDIYSFAIPQRGMTEKELKAWRKATMLYIGQQLDMLIGGSAQTFSMEVGTA